MTIDFDADLALQAATRELFLALADEIAAGVSAAVKATIQAAFDEGFKAGQDAS